MRWIGGLACMVAVALATSAATRADLVLVQDGVARVPVVVSPQAGESTRLAVESLVQTVKKMTGAQLEVVEGAPAEMPAQAIWIGDHAGLAALLPGVSLTFTKPEEVLIACRGSHLLIAGRDLVRGDKAIEHGTANAIYVFMERVLDVRWLWPGPLGEDVPARSTLSVAEMEYRFAPRMRQRLFWRGTYGEPMEGWTRAWFRQQHLQPHYSYQYSGGHAYTKWWEQYGQSHPDYFAKRSDGSRGPRRSPKDVKLCVSNPAVAAQWLDDAQKAFEQDPALLMLSATPNDGGDFCVCDNCRAMDPPDSPPAMGYVSLTDRYVKYWNILARGLRERFPDREVYVGAYAYSAYRTPPVVERLEANVALGYVGHFPLANDKVRESEQAAWSAWAQKVNGGMVFRPNLFHYSGGFVGLPSISPRKTISDWRFLADHQCVGVAVDSLPLNWSTQGVQYYLMAQMTYDPNRDGAAVLADYYARGFGPAASAVERYYTLMEQTHGAVLEQIVHSSGKAREAVTAYRSAWTPQVMQQAATLLDEAAKRVADGHETYRQRVAFVRIGCDFTALQMQIADAMAIVRESKGADRPAVERAIALCEQREALMKANYSNFALRHARWYQESRKMGDYMGPVSEEFRKAAGLP